MNIWVDADACPAVIKEILFRAVQRTKVQLTLVANKPVRIPKSTYISMLQVELGFDVADNEIIKKLKPNDLVITSDIPLAAEVLEKGGKALGFRGDLFTDEDIKSRLTMRDFMDTLRSSGVMTGGQSALNQADRQKFANQLDRILTQHQNR